MKLPKKISHLVICLFSYILTTLTVTSLAETDILLNWSFESRDYSKIVRQYQKYQCSSSEEYINNSLFRFVSSPVRAGQYAMRHYVRDCDERSELAIENGFFKQNKEYWIGWSIYIPSEFRVPGNRDHTIIQQMGYNWQDQGRGKTLYMCNGKVIEDGKIVKTRGAPGSEMRLSPDGKNIIYRLKTYSHQDREGRYIFECKEFSLPSKTDTWQDFVLYLNLDKDPQKSRTKLWKDGTLYIDEPGPHIAPHRENLGFWKIGAYLGHPGNGEALLYTDELKIGGKNSSYQQVSPSSHPDPN